MRTPTPAIAAAAALIAAWTPVSGHRPPVGDCAGRTNCVSTRAAAAAQRMPPLRVAGDPDAAMARLRRVVAAMPGARIVTDERDALRAEFRTRVFRFVDDVELALDRRAGVIHFRSASRVGRTDFGTNRRRMTELTRRFGAP